MPNTEAETSLPSSMNSGQASEYEEAESAFNSHANSDFYSFLELQQPAVQKIKAQLPYSNCPLPLKGRFLQFELLSSI